MAAIEVPDLRALGVEAAPSKEEIQTTIDSNDVEKIRAIARTLKELATSLKKQVDEGNAAVDPAKKAAEAIVADLGKIVGALVKAQKAPAAKAEKPAKPAKAAEAKKELAGGRAGEGIDVSREDNFGEWYVQAVTRSEMIEYYDISGCYILRPWAYQIWEEIQRYLDTRFKKSGVKNCYFPLLVSKRALTLEEDNFEDFCPEVAWVTKSGQSDLEEHIAIRPTSETVMYPAYAKWIRSHRDLPLRLNQWCNIVRWEFKDAVPFIRSREFLWQEGHSAYNNQKDADDEVLEILEYYRSAYEDLLAVPVKKGRKTDKEKFAGGLYTTTVEAYVAGTGRSVQAATSHCLGQNFSAERFFNIKYEDENGETQHVIQNSWGFTTRSIGIMVMVHGDDRGLVLPPRVAPIQVVVVPLEFKGEQNEAVNERAAQLVQELNDAGIRSELDARHGFTPLRKFQYWELRGVPIRIEIGPKDLENQVVTVCRRDVEYKKGDKKPTAALNEIVSFARNLMDDIHNSMLSRARALYDSHVVQISRWEEFIPNLNRKNFCLAPYCGLKECEVNIKDRSGEESQQLKDQEEKTTGKKSNLLTGAAKSLCIPFDQPELAAGTPCFACGKEAKFHTMFGRSY